MLFSYRLFQLIQEKVHTGATEFDLFCLTCLQTDFHWMELKFIYVCQTPIYVTFDTFYINQFGRLCHVDIVCLTPIQIC